MASIIDTDSIDLDSTAQDFETIQEPSTFERDVAQTLLAMRAEILDRVLAADSALRSRPFDGMDEGDLSFLNLEGELTAELERRDLKKLQIIDSTLVRLRTGHFGHCLQCGKPIARQRLRAIPYAVLCCSCQRNRELGR